MILSFLLTVSSTQLLNTFELLLICVLSYYALLGFLSRNSSPVKDIFTFDPKAEKEDSNLALPKKVFFVRHGQSLGNVRLETYTETPDWAVPLTAQGKKEAISAGLEIKEQCGDVPLVVYYSPYKRTKETMKNILRAFPKRQVTLIQQEPRIREQDFGNFQNYKKMKQCKKERLQFSRFFYRFPMGESGADVYDRVSSFMESLFRLFRKRHERDFNLLIVSHGLTIRIFLMRWFRWSVSEFETLANPNNATPVVLELVDESSRKYKITADSWKMLHRFSSLNLKKKAFKLTRRNSEISNIYDQLSQPSHIEGSEISLKELIEAKDCAEELTVTEPHQNAPQKILEEFIKEEAGKLEEQENISGEDSFLKTQEEKEILNTQSEENISIDTANVTNDKVFYKDKDKLKNKLKKFEESGYEGEFENGESQKFTGVEYLKE
eukprot:snap_masked-scaffold_1-processed-gene-22.45-mRNA-1 protein AED:0.16 eAED:0.16 QI:0/-1/0/1/-1/1/1/0/436